MPERLLYRYSLRSLLPGLAAMLAITATAGLALLTEHVSATRLQRQIETELVQTSKILTDRLDRRIFERYGDVQLYARLLPELDLLDHPQAIRQRFDELLKHYEGYAWIGYADRDGRIVAASGGLLEGVDISSKSWFTGAAKAAFVGDLHHAVLLEKKLNSGGAEPLRFLDIAMPVMYKDGTLAGVLGAHIDWRWLRNALTVAVSKERYEPLLVGENNTVLLGPADLQDQTLPDYLLKEIRRGNGFSIARWPDGKTYLTGYSQSVGYHAYPGLGWTILHRQELTHAFAPIAELRRQFLAWGAAFAGCFALLGWFLAARITRPLSAITQAAERLQNGDSEQKLPFTRGYREIEVLSSTLRSLMETVLKRDEQLEHLATHHSLTHLPNHTLIKALLGQAVANFASTKRQVAVLTLDLDRFKSVNNTLGHTAGDTVLTQMSDRLAACLGPYSTLGHIGKDEFVILVEEDEPALPRTAALTLRLMDDLSTPFVADGNEFHLSASVGISVFPRDAADVEALLRLSAMALYQAKAAGGRRIEFYGAQMNAAAVERMNLEQELRHAIELGQLELHYQPQVSLQTGAIAGVEALVRWRHPEHGLISPARFIPVAEASGLIVPIGTWVMNAACAQAKAWRRLGLAPLRMSVNVSAQQFKAEHFAAEVAAALARHELLPHCLNLEITETLLMDDIERSIALMHELVGFGVGIAIDDFGTGYSSLSYLKRLPISELKIDQSFVRDLCLHTEDRAIVIAVIALAQSLGLRVIAEGVETVEQRLALVQAGCEEIQGYYFSRPLTAEAFLQLWRNHHAQPGGEPGQMNAVAG